MHIALVGADFPTILYCCVNRVRIVGVKMKNALAGVLMLACAANAGATGVDFSLSNETANVAVLLNPYQFQAGGGSELVLGGFVNESGDNLLHATLMARGKRQSKDSVYTLGAGFRAVYGELEIDEEIVINGADSEKVGALGIGIQAGLLLASSRHTPVELIGEAFIAPSITSFTDADKYTEIGARLQVEVIPQARAYLGYRRISFDTNDYIGVNVDSGFHLGLNVSF